MKLKSVPPACHLTDTTNSLLEGFPRMLFFFKCAQEPECELGQ